MADLDTTSKRRSSVHTLNIWSTALPEPTLVFGDIDQGDRQHIVWDYSGILAVVITGQPFIMRGEGVPTVGRRDRPKSWN